MEPDEFKAGMKVRGTRKGTEGGWRSEPGTVIATSNAGLYLTTRHRDVDYFRFADWDFVRLIE